MESTITIKGYNNRNNEKQFKLDIIDKVNNKYIVKWIDNKPAYVSINGAFVYRFHKQNYNEVRKVFFHITDYKLT